MTGSLANKSASDFEVDPQLTGYFENKSVNNVEAAPYLVFIRD